VELFPLISILWRYTVLKRLHSALVPLVTATMTGHGLKDPDTAIRVAGCEPIQAKATKEAVMAAVGLA
jgi:hypothetical protein